MAVWGRYGTKAHAALKKEQAVWLMQVGKSGTKAFLLHVQRSGKSRIGAYNRIH